MRSKDFRVDITGRTGLPGALSTAATVYMPERVAVPATVIFAFAGAGLTRSYFDMDAAGGYSQAQYHVSDGFIFVSCDHLGTGDSTRPDPDLLDHENLAAANHATVTTLLRRLRDGSLVDGLPPIAIEKIIGIGQALGGCLITVQQALHGTFDAVALLGWSAKIVAAQAAALTVPVLLAAGERDAVADPWSEPSSYRSSKLVTVAVMQDMAQLHNVSVRRTELWERISDFAFIVRPRVDALT